MMTSERLEWLLTAVSNAEVKTLNHARAKGYYLQEIAEDLAEELEAENKKKTMQLVQGAES